VSLLAFLLEAMPVDRLERMAAQPLKLPALCVRNRATFGIIRR
jgi:hypothetical protein